MKQLDSAQVTATVELVERVLFRQNAGSVLLRVSRPPFDDAGHIEIAVLEIGPPAEQEGEFEEKDGPESSPQEPGP